MRFFTMAWWCGCQTDNDENASVGYHAHLATIHDRLPPTILNLAESVSLHDCRLRELRLAGGTLTMRIETYHTDELLTLLYSGVERFESTADPEIGLGGPHGYGDVGYFEVDALPGGTFEHRILFSTGIEFAIVFRDFRLERERKTEPPGAGADHNSTDGHEP